MAYCADEEESFLSDCCQRSSMNTEVYMDFFKYTEQNCSVHSRGGLRLNLNRNWPISDHLAKLRPPVKQLIYGDNVLKCWERWDKNPIEISKEQFKGQTTLGKGSCLDHKVQSVAKEPFQENIYDFRLNTDEYFENVFSPPPTEEGVLTGSTSEARAVFVPSVCCRVKIPQLQG